VSVTEGRTRVAESFTRGPLDIKRRLPQAQTNRQLVDPLACTDAASAKRSLNRQRYDCKVCPTSTLGSGGMDTDFAYDVFISYRQLEPDKTWVRKTLYPMLSEQGINAFIDFKHFRLGAPIVDEMERGVLESRYTLAVVSPAYLASTFTDFERVISQHLGLEQSQHRLLVLMREPCGLRLSLRYKLYVPMTTNEELAENLPTLVDALRQPSDA